MQCNTWHEFKSKLASMEVHLTLFALLGDSRVIHVALHLQRHRPLSFGLALVFPTVTHASRPTAFFTLLGRAP